MICSFAYFAFEGSSSRKNNNAFFLCVVVIFVGSNCYIDGWTVWPVVHFPLYIYFLSICHLPVCDVCLCVSHSEMIPCQTFSLRFYVWYRDIKLNISSHGVHVVWFKRDCLLLLLLCCALVFLYRAPRFFSRASLLVGWFDVLLFETKQALADLRWRTQKCQAICPTETKRQENAAFTPMAKLHAR